MAEKANCLHHRHYLWFFSITVFLLEFLIFRHRVLSEITPYYAAAFDQTSFLMKAYITYEISNNPGSFLAYVTHLFPIMGYFFHYKRF